MSSQVTSSPVSALVRTIFTRAPLRRSSWLNRTFFSEIAEYSFTGMLTRPKLIDPLQMARGIEGPPLGDAEHTVCPRRTPERRCRGRELIGAATTAALGPPG